MPASDAALKAAEQIVLQLGRSRERISAVAAIIDRAASTQMREVVNLCARRLADPSRANNPPYIQGIWDLATILLAHIERGGPPQSEVQDASKERP